MTPTRWRVVAVVVSVAVSLRLAMTAFPANFDFDSYVIVAELRRGQDNVYASTGRYNYGPPWFLVLDGLSRLAHALDVGRHGFRVLIVLVLSAADAGLAAVLWRRFGSRQALLFLFAPVGILITGQHNQFDDLAVLVGLLGVMVLGDRTRGRVLPAELAGLVLIGLSLSIKHLFVALPVWLAVKQTGVVRRAVVAGVPFLVFAFAFVPWLGGGGWAGIRANVLGYRSFENAPLLAGVLGDGIGSGPVPMGVLLIALGLGALLTRRMAGFDSALVHLLVLVVFAPALANQYLAVPLVALAAWWNRGFLVWMVAATVLLVAHPDGLDVVAVRDALPAELITPSGGRGYVVLAWLLGLGCLLALRAHDVRPRKGWLAAELRFHRRAMATAWGPDPGTPPTAGAPRLARIDGGSGERP